MSRTTSRPKKRSIGGCATEPRPSFSRCPGVPTRSVTFRSPCTQQAWVRGILFPALRDIRWRTVFFPRISSSGSTKGRATPRQSLSRFWMAKAGRRSSSPETADGAALGDQPPPAQREEMAGVYGAFAKSTCSTASGPIPRRICSRVASSSRRGNRHSGSTLRNCRTRSSCARCRS